MIPFFDLHCDTLGVAYDKDISLYSDSLQASLLYAESISPYIQVGAIWSDYRFDNEECFVRYKKAIGYARAQGIKEIKNVGDLKKSGYILAVEDARLLNGNLSRIKELKNDGIKIITPMWRGQNQLGGAWDTDIGLSNFGIDAIKECVFNSIIVDVSHASYKSFFQIADLMQKHNKSFIASHSNSYTIYPHRRNLTDEQFSFIKEQDGIIGINLVPQHLSPNKADISVILSHIYHFLSIGGENILCFGCDFDGTDALPEEIASMYDISKLYGFIEKELGKSITNKLFYQNAFNFFSRNI